MLYHKLHWGGGDRRAEFLRGTAAPCPPPPLNRPWLRWLLSQVAARQPHPACRVDALYCNRGSWNLQDWAMTDCSLADWKMTDWKMTDWKMIDWLTVMETMKWTISDVCEMFRVVSCSRTWALVAPSGECLRVEGLVWLIGAVVCWLAAAVDPIVR